MKTRQGFVSNSSSSSFIIITTKEVADKAKEGLSPYEKAVIRFVEETPPPFCGMEIVSYSVLSGNDDSFEYFDASDYDYESGTDDKEEDGPYDVWDNFSDKLKTLGKGKTIEHRESH